MMKSEGVTKNSLKHKSFDFTLEELNELDIVVKSKKFDVKKDIEVVYPENNIQKLRYFSNSLRLIEHLAYYFASMQNPEKHAIHMALSNKMKNILENYKNLYINSELLHEKYQKEGEFAKHRVRKAIATFLIGNSGKINALMDFVYQSGKHIVQVDPSQIAGYY